MASFERLWQTSTRRNHIEPKSLSPVLQFFAHTKFEVRISNVEVTLGAFGVRTSAFAIRSLMRFLGSLLQILAPCFILHPSTLAKADATSRLCFASFVFRDELFDRFEDDGELLVVFPLQSFNLSGKVTVGIHQPAQLDEGPHNGDVDLDRALRAKNAGKHGDALLGEGIRKRRNVSA
jgi:hypothetical protein